MTPETGAEEQPRLSKWLKCSLLQRGPGALEQPSPWKSLLARQGVRIPMEHGRALWTISNQQHWRQAEVRADNELLIGRGQTWPQRFQFLLSLPVTWQDIYANMVVVLLYISA